MAAGDTSLLVQAMLDAGTDDAWVELLTLARERFCRIARLLKGNRNLPDATDDLVQQVSLRLFRTAPEDRPRTARDYFGFVTLQIRRELIDLIRKIKQPTAPLLSRSDSSLRREPAGSTDDPVLLALWGEFHEKVGQLAEAEREVFELWWYEELKPGDIAGIVGASLATVKRRLSRARRQLHDLMGGQLPFR